MASHSLHRAAHIRNSLKALKKLLKHGGLFVNLEMTENNPLQLVSTAFLEDGFTHYKDERKRHVFHYYRKIVGSLFLKKRALQILHFSLMIQPLLSIYL